MGIKHKPQRFEVYLAELDPVIGSEISKTRPCLIVSPDESNHKIKTVLIAPMTSGRYSYPMRIPVTFKGKSGHVLIDQLRTVDKSRLIKKLGIIEKATAQEICEALQEYFHF